MYALADKGLFGLLLVLVISRLSLGFFPEVSSCFILFPFPTELAS